LTSKARTAYWSKAVAKTTWGSGLLVEQLLEDGEAIEAGHLDVEEDDVGLVGADEVDGFDAVGALGEDFDAAGGLEQVEQLLAGEGFVVDDEGGEGGEGIRVVSQVVRALVAIARSSFAERAFTARS
jgi:hypothetical protein